MDLQDGRCDAYVLVNLLIAAQILSSKICYSIASSRFSSSYAVFRHWDQRYSHINESALNPVVIDTHILTSSAYCHNSNRVLNPLIQDEIHGTQYRKLDSSALHLTGGLKPLTPAMILVIHPRSYSFQTHDYVLAIQA